MMITNLLFDYFLPYQLFPTVGFQIITESGSTEDPAKNRVKAEEK